MTFRGPTNGSWQAQVGLDLADEAGSVVHLSLPNGDLTPLRDLRGTVTLLTPLEVVGDLWPVFRDLGDELPVESRLTVRYGFTPGGYLLQDGDVGNVLKVAGFNPESPVELKEGREITARRVARDQGGARYSCTVVVPCRNEIGNVDALVQRVPQMGTHTEILFVDGHSSDGTPQRIEELIRENPDRDIKLLTQSRPPGKAGAVYDGFDAASGDILIILDADMTVAPEDLPRFYLALAEGVARFANGTRFVYPMADGAMPRLNNAGNRLFGAFFSWVLGTRVTDSLCGTKALFAGDWPAISAARPLFGGHDPWGDFDLLFGATYCGLDLIEIPVPYGARLAGESKMRPLQHGLTLAGTCIAGVRRLKLSGSRTGMRSP